MTALGTQELLSRTYRPGRVATRLSTGGAPEARLGGHGRPRMAGL
jgi:hypothetical protein